MVEQGWSSNDTELKVRRRIGDEKYLFLMQIFHYFEDVMVKAMEPDDVAGVASLVRASSTNRPPSASFV